MNRLVSSCLVAVNNMLKRMQADSCYVGSCTVRMYAIFYLLFGWSLCIHMCEHGQLSQFTTSK